MNGIADVISLLLGLSGFGMQPNPKAPTPDASLEYALPDADIVVHFDAASVVPNNYKKLVDLPNDPKIAASPDVAKMVRQAVTEVESARGLAKSMTGIDLATDVSDATAFVKWTVPGMDPEAMVAVHGKFTIATLDKIGTLVHKPPLKFKDGGGWLEIDQKNAVAVTHDGVLLVGANQALAARTHAEWKPPAHAAGTSLGYAYEMLSGKPVFGVSVSLSDIAKEAAISGLGGGQNFATDLVKRGKAWTFSLYHDGIGWTWVDSTKAGLDSMQEIANGTVELLRAAQIAPRGFSKIVMGSLESYRSDPRVDEVLKHKAEVMKIVESYIGDGTFKAKVDADAKNLKLTARLTGKSASDVVPFGMLLPVGAVVFFVSRASEPPPAKPMPAYNQRIAAPPVPAPLPPAGAKPAQPHK